jgi:glycosyltransferase involved in cell wall biosynthesis
LVVLGNYQNDNAYHREVKSVASDEVRFVGAIYDKTVVQALRCHCAVYVHGHQVGGTNPSLVEALGAGNAVIAHDNRFNRWVAGEGAIYFNGADGFARCMEELFAEPVQLEALRAHARRRFADQFTWPLVLQQYEELLTRFLPR